MLVISEQDNGLYDAINKGIKLSSGEIIGLLHSDDLFSNDEVLALVADTFKSDRSLNAVFADVMYILTQRTLRKLFDIIAQRTSLQIH